ncbi:PilN domain-containing protein [Litoreibacter roseus]|uniref:Uncharacterized protein n=1 Tax=Litoreibacter roseus TaxID=2601869 RepID=A0A6N6JJM6_9RHOB|nr:PilN domain-containing protein [Litoreibacter roseus]GFE66486.1 hypothetical protein KIN_35600 [Litoreibacter roseus]
MKTLTTKRFRRFLSLVQAGWAGLKNPASQTLTASQNQLFIGGKAYVLRTGGSDKRLANQAELATLLKPLKRQKIDLVFLDRACLDMNFTLPAGPLDEVKSMAATEIQFRSPFEESNSIAFWTARETPSTDWAITASVVLKTSIAWVLDAIEKNGLEVGFAVRKQADGSNLFAHRPPWSSSTTQSAKTGLRAIPSPFRLPLIAFAVLLISLAGVFATQTSERAALSAEAALAQQQMAALAQSVAAQRNARERRDASTQKLALVGELANILPDGTWLERFSIADGRMTITGYGPSAAEVTRLLSTLENLSDIKYGSPVTRDNSQGLERFRIVATLGEASP